MTEPIKWLYWDLTQARYVDDDDAEAYLTTNSGNTLVEVHVEQSNPLPSGAGVGLIPEKFPLLMRTDHILYELCASGNNLLLISSGNNLVEGFLPLSGGTLTGDLILDHDPILNLEAATKQYVDTQAGGGNGSSDIAFSFDGDDQTEGLSTNNISYEIHTSFRFAGTVSLGTPISIKCVVSLDRNDDTGFIRIKDQTNNNNIVTKSFTQDTKHILDLGSLSNLSSSEAVWEVHIRVGSNATITVHSLNIIF